MLHFEYEITGSTSSFFVILWTSRGDDIAYAAVPNPVAVPVVGVPRIRSLVS